METTLDSIRDIRLYQPKQGYRFSVDALLLYSFVNLMHVRKIADLGAGSGVVGLLLAKKYPKAKVDLIELQESLFKLAQKNIELNGLEDRVRAFKSDIRDINGFAGGRFRSGPWLVVGGLQSPHNQPYDLVVSNPPFRRPRAGRLSHEEENAVARHEVKLKLTELLSAASLLLRAKGKLCLVHLPERLPEPIGEMRHCALEPKRMRLVHSRPGAEAKMLLIEAVKEGRPGMKVEPPCFVYNEDACYTEEMQELFSGAEGRSTVPTLS